MKKVIKSLKDISWNVSEEEYRKSNYLSYSTLSKYDREGFKSIPKLFDKVDSPSLRYGSLLDCMLTDEDSLYKRFHFTDTKRPSDTIVKMVESLFHKCSDKYKNLEDVPSEIVLETLNTFKYYKNYSDQKRENLLVSGGKDYYKFMLESENKTIISLEDFTLAKSNESALKSHPFTAKYFFKDRFKDHIENLDQLKFKIEYKDSGVRCMFDKIIVDHERKLIIPCDLKTTGKDEHDFAESFVEWRYYLQATLYTYILRKVIALDDYFCDFEIGDYVFIIINKFNNAPLVWLFEDNFWEGEFYDKYNNRLKGWMELFDELSYYLSKNNFTYSKEVMDNKGVLKINSLKRRKE